MVPPIPIKAKVQPNVHVSILELLGKFTANRTAGLLDDCEDLLGFDRLTRSDVDFFDSSATGATTGISIFIASMTITTSSSSTWSPACFSIFNILPTMGASTDVAKVCLLLSGFVGVRQRRNRQQIFSRPFSRVYRGLSMLRNALRGNFLYGRKGLLRAFVVNLHLDFGWGIL